MSRQALLVLGAHRSGTSALAGALTQLGAQGPKTLMRPQADNPLGYWESDAFYEFHERLLRSAGSEWYDCTPFNPKWLDSTVAVEFAAEFRTLLNQEFDNAPLFVVKDPRICKFAPFWLRNLDAAHVATAAILMIRSPLEVAQSLRARDGFGTDGSLLIWLRHVLDAEFETRAIHRSFVRYHDLLDDWRAVVEKISADIGVTWPEQSRLRDGKIATVVRPDLCHHVVGIESIIATPRVLDWIMRASRAIDLLVEPSPARANEAFETLDDVRKEFDAATSTIGPILKEEQRELRRLVSRSEIESAETRRFVASLHGESQQLREQLEACHRQQEAVHAVAQAAAFENQRLRNELAAIGGDVQQLRSQFDSAQSRMRDIQRELDGTHEQIRTLTNERAGAQDRVDELLTSASWRVTALLRAVFRLLMRTQSH